MMIRLACICIACWMVTLKIMVLLYIVNNIKGASIYLNITYFESTHDWYRKHFKLYIVVTEREWNTTRDDDDDDEY